MRADIAALHQGVRNANDAISMIQTHDGALQVIDEKLIRLKELAEQAATGTYNSDQRLMIDSEFQAMKSEITRIATATDFNGIKLICNDKANKLYVGVGAEVVYGTPTLTVQGGVSSEIINPNAITADADVRYGKRQWSVTSKSGDANFDKWQIQHFDVGAYSPLRNVMTEMSFGYSASTNQWTLDQSTINAIAANGYDISVNQGLSNSTRLSIDLVPSGGGATQTIAFATGYMDALTSDMHVSMTANASSPWTFYSGKDAYPNIAYLGLDGTQSLYDLDGDGSADIKVQSGDFNLLSGITYAPASDYVSKIHFGTGNSSAEDYYYIRNSDCTANGLGIGSTRVETQDNGQKALDEVDGAIVRKDNVRAYLGAIQNRLENTISNLQIQAENLQAAESNISDVDVADEMTEFVRQQILSQAAVAMLSQANSLPQMALNLMS